VVHAIYAVVTLAALLLGGYLGHRFALMATVKILRRSFSAGGAQPMVQIHTLARVRDRLLNGEDVSAYIELELDRLTALAHAVTQGTAKEFADELLGDEDADGPS